ncbi:hypothetical protein PPERSA_01211 [Pseudocohnilembus persalinus]|uniref:Uncharacterized protein n=1 Tax=Pseudocohnilembus persalinus TaxID=266149 RepID=A0A0V0R944_PSEPJ|nr:hypothetical protein PPERSA_01211 [Pseudocohnilembus persalinus]|eukprot:KRX11012.1 hypothetical protein PPERSA_01211 [Pseudocohnilembus persalinus]
MQNQKKGILKKQVTFYTPTNQNLTESCHNIQDENNILTKKQNAPPKKKCSKLKNQGLVQKSKQLRPFDEKFFAQLGDLEDKIYQRKFNLDTINMLVEQYSKCVEYYDSKRDPISKYFQEKIQATLMNKKALKILFDNDKENIQINSSLNLLAKNQPNINTKKSSNLFKPINNNNPHYYNFDYDSNKIQNNNYIIGDLQNLNLTEDSSSTQNSYNQNDSIQMENILRNSSDNSTSVDSFSQQQAQQQQDQKFNVEAILNESDKIQQLNQQLMEEDVLQQENQIIQRVQSKIEERNLKCEQSITNEKSLIEV